MGSYHSKQDFYDLGYDIDEDENLTGETVLKILLVPVTVFFSMYLYETYYETYYIT